MPLPAPVARDRRRAVALEALVGESGGLVEASGLLCALLPHLLPGHAWFVAPAKAMPC
jgi:hypothetical protein